MNYPTLNAEDVPKVEGKCNAWNPGRQKRCAHEAGWGTDHPGTGMCKWHLGDLPAHRDKARRETAVDQLEPMGIPDVDAYDALVLVIRLQAQNVVRLAQRVVVASDEDLVKKGLASRWYQLLQQAQRDLTSTATAAARAGVEERQVQVAEGQAELLANVMRGFMKAMGIAETPETLAVVRQLMLQAAGGEVMEGLVIDNPDNRDVVIESSAVENGSDEPEHKESGDE